MQIEQTKMKIIVFL